MAIDKKVPEAIDITKFQMTWAECVEQARALASDSDTHPPMANRGGKVNSSNIFGGVSRYSQVVMNAKGKILEIPLRKGNKHAAFIDQITFSVDEESIQEHSQFNLLSDKDFIIYVSALLETIFGFGIWRKADHSGGRFYEQCWLLGSENANYGRVHFGGQRNTMLFELTGTGCNAAKDCWEVRLFDFLSSCIRPKITRIDLAHDFLNGEYSPDQAYTDWKMGGFTKAYRKPFCEKVGTDWEINTGKGKTFYVGSRQSSYFVRIYEKGKAFGDVNSLWTRAEVELKAKDIIIPLDVLLNAGEYFAGSYPVFEEMAETPERVHAIKKQLDLTYEKVVFYAKQQVGRAINAIKEMKENISDSQIVEMLRNEKGLLPSRLCPENFLVESTKLTFIHHKQQIDHDLRFIDDFKAFNPV